MSSSDLLKTDSNWKLAEQHHYQNQQDQLKKKSHISIQTPTTTASSISSQKSLLTKKPHHSRPYLNTLLILAAFLQLASLIGIVITFIFPFWTVFQIDMPDNLTNGFLNVTNLDNSISLTTLYNSETSDLLEQINNKLGRIKFDLGIWEVKMHRALQLTEPLSKINYKNSISMLWLNSDLASQPFLTLLTNFIKLNFSNIFTVQIIEILHLIFAFLSFSFTGFTLCLCSKHNTSLCWFLVSYFVTLVSFGTGLAVILLIVTWQILPNPILTSAPTGFLTVSKMLNWCFWTAVGINGSILTASFLILFFILISSIKVYNEKKRDFEKIRDNFKPSLTSFNSDTRLPRLQTNILKTEQRPNSGLLLLEQQQQQQLNSHSYIFYTGHGNYRKHDEYEIGGGDFLPVSKGSYSVLASYQPSDHAYSNVVENSNPSPEFLYSNHRR